MNECENELNLTALVSHDTLNTLRKGRNLLAFSHGVDSTALFYLLDDIGIKFDIAIVDYNERAQSKLEVAAARALAAKFNKQIYVLGVKIKDGNFESSARAARYEFFSEICTKFGYENLVLAHQLDDKFEWFLMQLGRGAGLNELLGMSQIEPRTKFTLIRPLLGVRKCELEAFLRTRELRYFTDDSNLSNKFFRNQIRHEFSEPFLDKFALGVKKSFEFLAGDALNLTPQILNPQDRIYLVKNDLNVIRGIDRVAKILGVVMSAAQKKECAKCLKKSVSCVIAGKIAVGYSENFIIITPHEKIVMPKSFKEACRLAKIPPVNRAYLHNINANLAILKEF